MTLLLTEATLKETGQVVVIVVIIIITDSWCHML